MWIILILPLAYHSLRQTLKVRDLEKNLGDLKIRLVKNSKLAALGEMAGEIAHEISNPLTLIQAQAFIIAQELSTKRIHNPNIEKAAHKTEQTVDRVVRIVKSVKLMNRDGDQDPCEKISVKDLIQETADLCDRRYYDHSIRFHIQLDLNDSPTIECRRVQISQVLLNLLCNAFDAVVEHPEKWVNIMVTSSDDHIQFSISDSGPGIPLEHREKIFQPFFTTKSATKGTGLGLSLCKNMVDRHQGKIYFDEKSTNTNFVVILPRRQSALGLNKRF